MSAVRQSDHWFHVWVYPRLILSSALKPSPCWSCLRLRPPIWPCHRPHRDGSILAAARTMRPRLARDTRVRSARCAMNNIFQRWSLVRIITTILAGYSWTKSTRLTFCPSLRFAFSQLPLRGGVHRGRILLSAYVLATSASLHSSFSCPKSAGVKDGQIWLRQSGRRCREIRSVFNLSLHSEHRSEGDECFDRMSISTSHHRLTGTINFDWWTAIDLDRSIIL